MKLHPGVFLSPMGDVYDHGVHMEYTPWCDCPCGARDWVSTYESQPAAVTPQAAAVSGVPDSRSGRRMHGYTMRGVVTLILPLTVLCRACNRGHVEVNGTAVAAPHRGRPLDHIDLEAWWPVTLSKPSTVLHVELLRVLLAMRKQKPNVGDDALLGIVHRLATALCGDPLEGTSFSHLVRRITASDAIREWGYCQHEFARLGGEDSTLCPRCGLDPPLSVACDANVKLHRRNKPGPDASRAYFNSLFLPTELVDTHMRCFPAPVVRAEGRSIAAVAGAGSVATGQLSSSQRPCDVKSGRETHDTCTSDLDEHGVYGCSCGHDHIIALVRMYRNENKAHMHTMAAHVLMVIQAHIVFLDNGCGGWNGLRSRSQGDADLLTAAHAAERQARDAEQAVGAADATPGAARAAAALRFAAAQLAHAVAMRLAVPLPPRQAGKSTGPRAAGERCRCAAIIPAEMQYAHSS